MRSKKELAVRLSMVKGFENPEMREEQYMTPSEIASEILWNACFRGHIERKVIVDLGCGTGILGIGCMLLGAKKVYFVEKDSKALEICRENVKSILGKPENEEYIEGSIEKFNTKVDTALCNPPFGTKKRHADAEFLKKALETAKVSYSFHKSSTIPYLKKIAENNGFSLAEKFDFEFMLWNTMGHHTRKRHYIEVSCLAFCRHSDETTPDERKA